MNSVNTRNSGKGDLRGFKYPLEPLAKRAQWELDELNGKIAKAQHELISVRAELDAAETLHSQASDSVGRQFQVHLDSSRHRAGLVYLAQLQASMEKIHAQLDTVSRARDALVLLRRAAETRLEALRSHESGAIDIYAREQSRLHASEADRDWMMREAFKRVPANPQVESGGSV